MQINERGCDPIKYFYKKIKAWVWPTDYSLQNSYLESMTLSQPQSENLDENLPRWSYSFINSHLDGHATQVYPKSNGGEKISPGKFSHS